MLVPSVLSSDIFYTLKDRLDKLSLNVSFPGISNILKACYFNLSFGLNWVLLEGFWQEVSPFSGIFP